VNEARSLIERLIKADAHDRRRTIAGMTQAGLAKCEGLFALWAHPSQLPPPSGDWRIWLLLAGRGFGKTRAGAEWVFGQAVARPQARIALVGANIADARSIMVEGVSAGRSVVTAANIPAGISARHGGHRHLPCDRF